MTADATRALVMAYYEAFNAADVETMIACLTPDIVHEVSQGGTRHGREAFAAFLAHMNARYRERLSDIVVMVDGTGARAAAEFHLDGTYVASDEGLPAAEGQSYALRVGAFFEIAGTADGPRIARVSTHYNLADWTAQVEGRAGG